MTGAITDAQDLAKAWDEGYRSAMETDGWSAVNPYRRRVADDDHAAINAVINEYVKTTRYSRDTLTTLAMNHPDVDEFRFIVREKLANPLLSFDYIATTYGVNPIPRAGE